MSEEVKPTGIGLTISNINHDMMVRKLQSERQARLDAETKLRELQDLLYFEEIIDKGNHDSDNLPEGFESQYYDELDQDEAQRLMILRDQAIQESRTRRQNDDTTI
jgi:hypothetical protein